MLSALLKQHWPHYVTASGNCKLKATTVLLRQEDSSYFETSEVLPSNVLPGDLFLVPAGEHGFPLLVRVPPIPNNMRHRSVVRVLSIRIPSVAAPTSEEAIAVHATNEIVVVSPEPAVLSSVADGDVVAVAITTSDKRVVYTRVPLSAIQNGAFEVEIPSTAVRRGSGYFSLATIQSASKLASAACGVEWTECVLPWCRIILSALDPPRLVCA